MQYETPEVQKQSHDGIEFISASGPLPYANEEPFDVEVGKPTGMAEKIVGAKVKRLSQEIIDKAFPDKKDDYRPKPSQYKRKGGRIIVSEEAFDEFEALAGDSDQPC